MSYCPVAKAAKSRPNHVAIYSDKGTFTYQQLDDLIDKAPNEIETFYAEASVESIVRFFSLLRRGKVAFPISKREPFLPNVDSSTVPEGVKTLICTSGTMGKPKIAMHTIKHHVYSAMNQPSGVAMSQDDAYLLSLPLNHISGISILFRAFCAEASLIVGAVHKRFATHISFVPTQLSRFLQSGERMFFNRLKCVLLGGGPLQKQLCDWAVDRRIPLFITYGMTEMASQIATRRYCKEKGICFGPPLEGRDYKVDEDGEIWVTGMTLFRGYLDQPSPIVDGWFPTKDLGRMSEHGLEVIGRKDRMIVSGGENVYLDELEALLLDIPQVDTVLVSSRKSMTYGERPKVDLRMKGKLSKREIIAKLMEILPKYKIPDEKDILIHQ